MFVNGIVQSSEGKSGQAVLSVRNGGSISPSGGTITALGGAVTIVVPAGAVTSTTDLFVDPAASAPADPRLLPGTAFDFGPSGTTFSTPVTLKLKYNASAAPNGNKSALQIYQAVGSAWQPVSGGKVDSTNSAVSVSIANFSTYAVLGQARVVTVAVTPPSTTLPIGSTLQLAATP